MQSEATRTTPAYQVTFSFLKTWTPDQNLARSQADTIYGVPGEPPVAAEAA